MYGLNPLPLNIYGGVGGRGGYANYSTKNLLTVCTITCQHFHVPACG